MSTPEFVKMKKIQIKPKNVRFRTTIIWLHVGYNLKNIIAIFEISTLEFLKNSEIWYAVFGCFGKHF